MATTRGKKPASGLLTRGGHAVHRAPRRRAREDIRPWQGHHVLPQWSRRAQPRRANKSRRRNEAGRITQKRKRLHQPEPSR